MALIPLVTCLFVTLLESTRSERAPSEIIRTTGRCRASCLDKFGARMDRLTDRSCLGSSDCFMCWENCAMMSRSWQMWGLMCQDRSICFPGCRAACHYYSRVMDSPDLPELSWHAAGQLTVELGFGQARLQWPALRPFRESVDHPHLVYLIFWQPKGSTVWKLLKQTIELEVSALGPVGTLLWPRDEPSSSPVPVADETEANFLSTDGHAEGEHGTLITICFVVTFLCLLIFGGSFTAVYFCYKPQNEVVFGGRHYAFRDRGRTRSQVQNRSRSLKGRHGCTASTTQLLRTDSLASVQVHKIQRPATPSGNKVSCPPAKPPRTFGWRLRSSVGEPQVIAIIEGQKHDVVTVNHALAKKILEAQDSVTV